MKTKESKTTACLHIALLVITIVFFVSCGKDAISTALLRDAESLMEEKPDSAYALLQQADSMVTFNRAQRAEWNLLVTQAMDKAYMEHSSDSLIREAMNYFEKGKNPERLRLAYFYMGRISQDLGDALRAQEYYLKALEMKTAKKDNNLLGLIHNHIGVLYTWERVYDKALPYLIKGLEYMEKAENLKGCSFVLRNIARVYRQQKEIEKAITYYNAALVKADEINRL